LATPIGDLPDFEDPRCMRLLGDGDDPAEAVAWLAASARDSGRVPAARALAEARLGVDKGGDDLYEVYRRLGVESAGGAETTGSGA
ncbi:MAG TPA: hypothetical protein VJ997_00065, partial [Longimicrobiales bacterium]|nr:hypothetical protein [Longimicrobiales bacterium]